ncbi:MAG: hypothetical protein ACWA5P_13765 [bacterium]
MRIATLIILFSVFLNVSAQQALRNPVERNGWTQLAANGQLFNFFGMRPETSGTVYLYERWKNIAILETDDGERMMLRNVNFNVDTQQFEALFSGDSIFTINANDLNTITLNNKRYKPMVHQKRTKMFEVMFESNQFTLLKEYRLNVFEASYNPMVARKVERYSKRQNYFIVKGDSFNEINLNRKNALKLLKNFSKNDIEEFVLKNQLSYKEEIDWVNLLKHFID